jgi:hypothetical protein
VSLYKGASQKLITPGSNDPRIIPCGAILHSAGGQARSLYEYFAGPSGGIESHFHIAKDGYTEQYRDTWWEADANYQGNSFIRDDLRRGFISIETQGTGTEDWTPEQIREIKALLLWASSGAGHDFQLRRCPAWNEDGVGYHIMWGAPGPWTPYAKVCPGQPRIRQFDQILVPWMSNPLEDGMSAEDVAAVNAHTDAAANWLLRQLPDVPVRDLDKDEDIGLQAMLGWTMRRVERTEKTVKDLAGRPASTTVELDAAQLAALADLIVERLPKPPTSGTWTAAWT